MHLLIPLVLWNCNHYNFQMFIRIPLICQRTPASSSSKFQHQADLRSRNAKHWPKCWVRGELLTSNVRRSLIKLEKEEVRWHKRLKNELLLNYRIGCGSILNSFASHLSGRGFNSNYLWSRLINLFGPTFNKTLLTATRNQNLYLEADIDQVLSRIRPKQVSLFPGQAAARLELATMKSVLTFSTIALALAWPLKAQEGSGKYHTRLKFSGVTISSLFCKRNGDY